VDGYDQKKIGKIRARVVGCGALGNYVALALTGFGVSTIGLYDPDSIEDSNLNRQLVFANEDVGKNKATALKARLEERMAGGTIVESFEDEVNEGNIEFMLPANDTDIVFLCVDNMDARLVMNDYLVKSKIPFINGGTDNGIAGEVCTIIPGQTPCLRCFCKPDPTRDPCSRKKNPSIVGNSILIASLMIVEFQNWALGKKTTPPVLKFTSSRFVPVEDTVDENVDLSNMIPQPFYYIKINMAKNCICQKR
jgi:adenylyltransferase/sulfurtransferase